MPQVKSSFVLNSPQPLDLRDSLTLKEMRAKGKNDVDEGHITYCKAGETENDEYEGRYFIFMPNLPYTTQLGYYKDFTLDDIVIFPKRSGLKSYDATLLPTGKLVYCMEDKMMYYNRYYSQANVNDNTIYNSETGYFWKLVDLSSSDYVSKNTDEWRDLINKVNVLYDNDIKIFDTVDDLIEEIDIYKNEWPYSKGQLVYCKEIESHLYNVYTQDDIDASDDKEKLKGWFGYFRLLDNSNSKPIVIDPILTISPYDESATYDGPWISAKKNGIDILVNDITDTSQDWLTSQPNSDAIKYNLDRGTINYEDYKYFPKNEYGNEISFYYITGNVTITKMVPRVLGNAYAVGDHKYYVYYNINAKENNTSPYKDQHGIDLKDRYTKIESNDIIFNYTKPIYATTDRSGLVKQKLIPWDEKMEAEFKLVATAHKPQQIKTPRPIQHLYIKSLSNYIEENINDWNMVETTENTHSYYTYTYNTNKNGHRGDAYIKIEF